jgi:hypothetical protein
LFWLRAGGFEVNKLPTARVVRLFAEASVASGVGKGVKLGLQRNGYFTREQVFGHRCLDVQSPHTHLNQGIVIIHLPQLKISGKHPQGSPAFILSISASPGLFFKLLLSVLSAVGLKLQVCHIVSFSNSISVRRGTSCFC